MTRLLLSLAFAASLAGAATFTGIISDSMCKGDHKHMKMGADPDCTRACVKSGSKYVIWDGKNAYKLSDQQTPAKFAAQKVTVTGTLYEKTGVIKVDKIEAAK